MTQTISINNLNKIANNFLQENYNMSLTIPIKINGRLTRALGRYRYKLKDNKPIEIELSKKLVEYGHSDIVLDILKHELIHYALHVLGKPHKDGQPYFENELKKLSVSSTHTYHAIGKLYVMQCISCNKDIKTHRKAIINKINQYQSNCCKTKLAYAKTVINNGYELIPTI